MHMEKQRPLGGSGIYQKQPVSYSHFRDSSFDYGSHSNVSNSLELPVLMMRQSPSFTPAPINTVNNDYQMPLKKM